MGEKVCRRGEGTLVVISLLPRQNGDGMKGGLNGEKDRGEAVADVAI